MSTFIDSIFDKIGNVILPKTVTKAVWGQTSGNRLDQELDGIEAALAQPNTGDNADIAYSAGKYIYHVKNKELYRAKSNIASGAAFNKASGGNVDVVNIGDQLQTISSDLADVRIKYDTFSGTTDIGGDIALGTNVSARIVVAVASVGSADSYLFVPKTTTAGLWYVTTLKYSGDTGNIELQKNKAVSGRYYYVDV